MVWACDEKKVALYVGRRVMGNHMKVTLMETEERTVLEKMVGQGEGDWDDIEEKGLSEKEVYDRATWRRMSLYIDPT